MSTRNLSSSTRSIFFLSSSVISLETGRVLFDMSDYSDNYTYPKRHGRVIIPHGTAALNGTHVFFPSLSFSILGGTGAIGVAISTVAAVNTSSSPPASNVLRALTSEYGTFLSKA